MKKKIVITDDDLGIQEIFKLIFEKEGYETIILSSPIEIFQHHFEDADIFLLDRQMCGIDGLDVCRYLKQNEATRNTPVIIISATPNFTAISKLAGANDFIEKPFTKKDLLNRVALSLQH